MFGSMSSHLMTQHGKAAAWRQLWTPQTDEGPRIYKMYFPAKGGPRWCPLEECPGALATRTAMRVHFMHRHVHNIGVMLEEGNLPLPWCPRCDLQVPSKGALPIFCHPDRLCEAPCNPALEGVQD